MEDPWAAGSSWTAAKAPQPDEAASPTTGAATTFSPPPGNFDVSDPWGVQPTPVRLPGEDAVKREEESQPDNGWGGADDTPTWGGDVLSDLGGMRISSPPAHGETEDVAEAGWGGEAPNMSTSLGLPDQAEYLGETQDSQATYEAGPSTPIRSPSPRPPLSPPSQIPSFSPSISPRPFDSDLPALTIPQSPSSGDDGFGGFSAGVAAASDPWGTNADAGGGWDGGESSQRGSIDGGNGSAPNTWDDDQGIADGRSEASADGDEGEGWGGVRAPRIMPQEQVRSDENDWEEEQRRIRIQEERMPWEKIEGMKNQWKEVADGLIVDKLEALSEEDEENLRDGVRKMQSGAGEALRSLSAIPPDINTYPPVITSLETHERHVYALSRPNPSPSTSLLSVSLNRRPRRIETLDAQSAWTTRSKLGEPDAPPVETANAAEAQPKGWSFWRKTTAERPLTTSGGGVLEVMSPTAPSLNRTSSEMKTFSKPSSIMGNPSRPASPAPAAPLSSHMASPGTETSGHAAPSGIIESTSASSINPQPPVSTPAPAPSAVSRFFGRLGRSKTPVSAVGAANADNNDLELSADDFHFLSEVPSFSETHDADVGDLLSMEPGRTEQIAGLQSMLASKPTNLPAPLAPPPRGSAAVRTNSAGSGKFVAKMKQPIPSDMDLLGGLSFDDDPTTTPPPRPISKSPQPQITTRGSNSVSMWDDFLAPAPAQTSSQPANPPPATYHNTPFAAPYTSPPSSSQNPQPPIKSAPVTLTSVATPPSTQAPTSDDFDDFDFGTPQKASAAQFDDFDFSSFDTPITKRAQAYPSRDQSVPKPQLDHTPARSLVSEASANKGQRWPAPASPVGPILEPPPRATPGGFPFLSPPPSSSRTPRQGTPVAGPMDLLGETSEASKEQRAGGASALRSPPNLRSSGAGGVGGMGGMGGMLPTPPRAGSPLVPASTGMSKPTQSAGGSQGGLSASDLSFFDSL